jgi:hypothetical protein
MQMVSGDFNSDGIPDLAVLTNPSSGVVTLVLLLGNGDGTFTPAASSNVPDENYFEGNIVVADFNNDGIPDLAISVSGNGGTPGPAVLLGRGDGTFTEILSNLNITGDAMVYALTTDDFNGDGIQDLVYVTNVGVNVLLGNGDGTFTSVVPSGVYSPGIPEQAVVADFNGDGIPDLVVTTSSSVGGVYLFIGNGNGTFSAGLTLEQQYDFAYVAVGDFNGDGIPDLATTGTETLLLGKGDGTFSPYSYSNLQWPPAGGYIYMIAAADFTGDGTSDLALTHSLSDVGNPGNELITALITQQKTGPLTISANLAYGLHLIEANYSGDSNFSPSVGGPVAIDNQIPTTLSLNASPSAGITVGQTTTLSAILSPFSYQSDTTNGETVSFYDNSTLLGTGTLSGGVATLLTPITVVTNNLTVTYAGDNNFAASTGLMTVNAAQGQPTLTLSANPSDSSLPGQIIALTAALTGYGITNGETITFLSGTQTIGTATLTGGSATVNVSNLPLGSYSFTATYPGDTNNLNATSNALSYQVEERGQATAVALAITSAGVPVTSSTSGTPVTLTAALTAGNVIATRGTVIFCDTSLGGTCTGAAELGSAQLTSSGTAAILIRPGIGIHTMQAFYAGSSTLAPSTSNQAALTVTGAPYASKVALSQYGLGNPLDLLVTVESGPALLTAGPLSGILDIVDQTDSNTILSSTSVPAGPYASAAFSTMKTSPATGSNPFSIASADFNKDGIPDLVTANSGDNDVSVLLGNGDGTFKTQVSYGAGTGAFSVSTGDFNNDGNSDIAVTNFSSGTVSILLGNGDGTFQAQNAYAVGTGPAAIVVGDFNGDGNLDLAITNENDNTISILLGKGDGTFQAQQTFATGNGPSGVAAADFNKDGYLDLAVANNTDGTVGILLGKGDGTFEAMVPYAVGAGPLSVTTADLNNDGFIDLAVACPSSNTVSILFGNGDGTFQPQQAYIEDTNAGAEAVVAANIAETGNMDLAVVYSTENAIRVFVNNGSGQFQDIHKFSTGEGPVSMVLGDWNGDGMLDAATANNSSNTISTLLNASYFSSQIYLNPIAAPGDHTLVAQYHGNSNFAASTSAPVQVSNSPQTTQLSLVSSGAPNPTNYGQFVTLVATLSPYSVGAFNTNGESIIFAVGGNTIGTANLVSGVATLTLSTLPVGLDSVTASYVENNLFASSNSNAISQTVRPIILTVTSSNTSRAYGAANPAFTGTTSGAVNGDTFTVSGTTTAAAVSAPGAYTITPTVTGTNVANYTVTRVNGTLTVTQAALTVTASNVSRAYGAANPAFTGTVSGAANGDSFIVTGATTATATSLPGTYAITPAITGTNLANYTVAKVNGTLTVTQAPLTVTAANASRPYGAANPAFTGTASGAVNGDTFTVSATSTATATSAAGTYPITPTVTGSNLSNYTVTDVSGTLTITQLPLTVTAANASRIYGAANPTFTGTVSGAINGDTFAVSGTTAATATSAPGMYPITPTAAGANLSDYTVTPVNGALTVTQATPNIDLTSSAFEAYVSAPVTFTSTVASVFSGASPTGQISFYDGTTLLGATSLSSGVGTYTTSSLSVGQHLITVAYAGDTNYTTLTSPQVSELIVSPAFMFTTASGSTSLATASPGGTTTYTLNVTPPSGITFENPISFAVTGLPTGATATFSPATVAAGAGSTNVTLTVAIPSTASAANRENPFSALPVAIGLILLPVAGLRRFRKQTGITTIVLIVAGVALAAALTGCGGGGSSSGGGGGGGSTPQSYSLTVTATSGSVAQNASLTLTVQ